jgi:hypothetical protein
MTMGGRKLNQLMDLNSERIRDPEIIKAVGNWYGELRNAVETTADKAGVLAKFQNAMAEYKNALRVRTAVNTAGTVAATAGAAPALKATGLGPTVVQYLRGVLGIP